MYPPPPPCGALSMLSRVRRAAIAAPCALAAAAPGAAAKDLFEVEVTIGMETERRSFSSAEDALRLVEDENLENLFPDYERGDPDAATARINFRGLEMHAEFDEGSDTLAFRVPDLDIDETFAGADREAAVDEFVEFMKSEGRDILDDIQNELARVSPIDPIAGNPASLQAMLVGEAFDNGAFAVGRPRADDEIGISVSGGAWKMAGYSGRSATVAPEYGFVFAGEPGMKLRIRVPARYQDVEGAAVFAVAPNLSLTASVADGWTLTPTAMWGATASVDAGSVAQMIGGALASSYEIPRFPTADATLTVGNMIGYVRTLKLSIRDYSFDPGIANTVLKNGVMAEMPIDGALFGGDALSARASYAFTALLGDDLFMNRWHELALELASIQADSGLLAEEFRLGLSFAFGGDYRGFGARLVWRF